MKLIINTDFCVAIPPRIGILDKYDENGHFIKRTITGRHKGNCEFCGKPLKTHEGYTELEPPKMNIL